MSNLRQAAQQALEALENASDIMDSWAQKRQDDAITALRAALAEPVQEPVAWMHNLIDDNIIAHRPADIDRHPDRWTALYQAPQPCPTCEALARTVMLDQTSHDTAPPQRKPLTRKEVLAIVDAQEAYRKSGLPMFYRDQAYNMIRDAERAHGIGGSDK